MARDHARLRHSIWADAEFLALTEAAQRVYMLALSQPGLNYCGVVPFTLRRWAKLASDSTTRRLRTAVTALETARFVVVDEDSEELLIRSFIRNDGIIESPNICLAAVKAFPGVLSPLLKGVFVAELHRLRASPQGKGWEKGWEAFAPLLRITVPQGLPQGFHERFCEPWGESRARACPCPDPYPSPVPDGSGHQAFLDVRQRISGRSA